MAEEFTITTRIHQEGYPSNRLFLCKGRPCRLMDQGIYGVHIHNISTTDREFHISVTPSSPILCAEVMTPTVAIPAGQRGGVCIRFKQKRMLFGQNRSFPFTINISSVSTNRTLTGQLISRPLISKWQLTVCLALFSGLTAATLI